MNLVLIDTNILVDHLRGQNLAISFLTRLLSIKSTIFCSVITRIELLSSMRPKEGSYIISLLQIFNEVNIEREIAIIAGMYMNTYASSHGLNTADAIIAASAKFVNATLYTLNIKHFPMKDIEILKPY